MAEGWSTPARKPRRERLSSQLLPGDRSTAAGIGVYDREIVLLYRHVKVWFAFVALSAFGSTSDHGLVLSLFFVSIPQSCMR